MAFGERSGFMLNEDSSGHNLWFPIYEAIYDG
jgi:hypothetical protein